MTVSVSGEISIEAAAEGLLVSFQMPLPTTEIPVLSSACAIPATATAADALSFSPSYRVPPNCPPVWIGHCELSLEVKTAKGALPQPNRLRLNGDGNFFTAAPRVNPGGCGGAMTDSFTFETLATR